MILGGEPDKSVITFDPTTSTYTSGPDMLNGRENFGCAHFYSDAHFGRPVVLAAGGLGTSKAEILDYSGSGTWTSSKLLLNLNTIGGRWYFGRVLVPLRLKNQSLYHKILLLQMGEGF